MPTLKVDFYTLPKASIGSLPPDLRQALGDNSDIYARLFPSARRTGILVGSGGCARDCLVTASIGGSVAVSLWRRRR